MVIQQTGPDGKERSLKLWNITALPPKFMKSAQSFKLLQDYYKDHLKDHKVEQNQLTQGLKKHVVKTGFQKTQNCYISRQSLKYHLFVLGALTLLKQETIERIIQPILLRAYRSTDDISIIKTPSDIHRKPKSKL